jgi:hypothetical protein
MRYLIKNNLPILLEWVNKKNYEIKSEPNSKSCLYDLNDYGYRASHDYEDIIDDENKIICLGCSFTFGSGLYESETWPYKLSKLLKCNYMNLGFPGGSSDYVLWQLYNILDKIPYKKVFILNPPMGRCFTLSDDNFENKAGVMEYNESHFKQFLVKNVSENNGINYLNYNIFGEYGTEYQFDFGTARDGVHYGEQWQTEISKEFYKKTIKLI